MHRLWYVLELLCTYGVEAPKGQSRSPRSMNTGNSRSIERRAVGGENVGPKFVNRHRPQSTRNIFHTHAPQQGACAGWAAWLQTAPLNRGAKTVPPVELQWALEECMPHTPTAPWTHENPALKTLRHKRAKSWPSPGDTVVTRECSNRPFPEHEGRKEQLALRRLATRAN